MGQEKPLGPQESEVVAEQTRVSGCLVHLTRDTSGPETQLSCPQHSGWWLLKEVASAMTVTTAMTTMKSCRMLSHLCLILLDVTGNVKQGSFLK